MPPPTTEPRARLTRAGWLAAAVAAVLFAAVLSLAVGSRPLSPGEVWQALLGEGDSGAAQVVRDMRLPRTILGILVGAALGMSGVALQGITRNPIAEPGILGISQGASVAVLVAIAFTGVSTLAGYVWFAFAGAGVAALAAYAVATHGRGGATPVKLALAGAAIGALLASVTAAILTTRAASLDQFRFWQVGSLTGRDMEIVTQVWPFLLAGAVMVAATARGLDALALGDDVAKGLGQSVGAIRISGGVGATVLAGGAVAAAGPIAFVGLAVPHMARALVGTAHRWVLPLSALLGAVVLLGSDVIGRVVFQPAEVPAGVMTALIGVPFLIVLVRRKGVAA